MEFLKFYGFYFLIIYLVSAVLVNLVVFVCRKTGGKDLDREITLASLIPILNTLLFVFTLIVIWVGVREILRDQYQFWIFKKYIEIKYSNKTDPRMLRSMLKAEQRFMSFMAEALKKN